jgi:hypothetical protein
VRFDKYNFSITLSEKNNGNFFGIQSFRVIFAPPKINMKEKIIAKATQLFLKLGFKSVTMDDIANEMCISKKTIYKSFVENCTLTLESALSICLIHATT